MPEAHDWSTRIDAWLKQHSPDYADVLAPPAEAHELADAGVPDEVAAIFRWHDGQTDGGARSIVGTLFLMSIEDMAYQRKENAGTAKDLDDPTWWKDTWYPFLDDGQGNLVCFDSASKRLVFYEHDSSDRTELAPSIAVFFGTLATGLESGYLVSDQGATVLAEEQRGAWEQLLEDADVIVPSV
jgi:cell wall assembly regulator SMI1